MEIKRGYKQTEVGVIPEDWGTELLEKCLLCPPMYGINAPAVPYSDRLPLYIRITDITESGQFSSKDKVSVRSDYSENYYLNEGDLVFARTGASVGKSYLYNPKDGKLVFAGFLIRIRPNPEILMPSFLAAYIQTENYRRWVRVMSMRSGQPGINGNEYGLLMLPLPPLPEQRAIAAALSDVDGLLEGLERLIAKKRDLKQATMQQLLTAQTRLLGFSDMWENKRIGEFTDCTAGGTPSTKVASYWGGPIPWMSSGDLNMKRVYAVDGRITESGLVNSSSKLIPKHCVLIGLAGQGKTRGTVAMNFVELCTNQSIAAIFPNQSFISDYLYHNLDARYEELRDLSAGDGGRGGLNLKTIKSIQIPLPSLAEQTAIAAVLSDMDAELAALEQRRDKTRALKQAMMQELLTGKTRLIRPPSTK